MEKEILKMKSEIITINRKDRYLYNNANTLNLKILNIENFNSVITSFIKHLYSGCSNLTVILSPNSLFSTGITANRVLGMPSR
jgi:hypothetical protein